ncbi:MAG: hypothetical protein FJ403_17100 [Verrucomicrobia bacterium]|nr:hypothetical protein [Verrucomicrobiota bacterium]
MNRAGARPRICVLIPVGKMFDEVYVAVEASTRELGAECERVAAEFSEQSALTRAQAQIADTSIVIADITARNPNVLYQIGYAHALRKPVLLLTQHGEDLPFDRAEHRIVIYAGSIAALKEELRINLRNMLAPASESGRAKQGTPEAAANGQMAAPVPSTARERFFSIFGDIMQAHGQQHYGTVRLENENTFVVGNQDFSLALVEDLVRRARGLGIRLKLL